MQAAGFGIMATPPSGVNAHGLGIGTPSFGKRATNELPSQRGVKRQLFADEPEAKLDSVVVEKDIQLENAVQAFRAFEAKCAEEAKKKKKQRIYQPLSDMYDNIKEDFNRCVDHKILKRREAKVYMGRMDAAWNSMF